MKKKNENKKITGHSMKVRVRKPLLFFFSFFVNKKDKKKILAKYSKNSYYYFTFCTSLSP